MKKYFIISIVLLYLTLFYFSIVKASTKSELLILIEDYKIENDFIGIDAYCDKVYKTIPGIKGSVVNIGESYENMKENGIFDEKLIKFNSINVKSIDDVNCGPIYKGNQNQNKASLIINVAWGEEYIDGILKTLDEYQLKGNFFIEGKWALKNLELLYEINSRGHLIGNHSYSHKDFNSISNEVAITEIIEANNVIESLINRKVDYFGPPSGSFNNDTLSIVENLKMKTVLWSLDTIDWQRPTVETIHSRILPYLDNGSIILMHPTKNTSLALEGIILDGINKDIEFVNLDNLFYS